MAIKDSYDGCFQINCSYIHATGDFTSNAIQITMSQYIYCGIAGHTWWGAKFYHITISVHRMP